MTNAWEQDWQKLIEREVSRCGFNSLFEYMRADECADFTTIAEHLGGECLVPVQIERVFRQQSLERQELAYFVKSSLVRRLNHFTPLGWRKHGDWALSQAIASWGGIVGVTKELESMCGVIAKQTRKRTDISDSWLPKTTEDPVLSSLFQGFDFQGLVS